MLLARITWFLRETGAAALDLLFPPPLPCALCRGPLSVSTEVGVCESCLDRIGQIGTERCDRCGRPIDRARRRREAGNRTRFGIGRIAGLITGRNERESVLCRQCETWPPLIDYGRGYGVYQGYLRSCIHALKYRGELVIARGLGELMAWLVAVDPGFAGVKMVVPVPLHPRRLRERGYNQALELAKAVGGALGLPVVEAVRRTRETAPQSSLSWRERRENTRGAFEVSFPERVRGRSVLIVDDVYTTGATASAVALTLKQAGSPRVCGIFAAIGAVEDDFRPRSDRAVVER